MLRRTLLPAMMAALLSATPAFAAKELWSCTFTQRCDETGCEPADSRLTVQMNTDSQSALITYADTGEFQSQFDARVLTQGDVRHVIFDNISGLEATTMTETGPAIMTGHMIYGDAIQGMELIYYRLEGTCSHDS